METTYYFTEKTLTIVTHNGVCHSDDAACVALLEMLCEKQGIETRVIRTRDKKVLDTIEGQYIVVDVFGGEFDHHDKSKAVYVDGRELASIGKLWRFFKKDIIEVLGIDQFGWLKIDKDFISCIDHTDNTGEMNPFNLIFNSFRDLASDSNEAWEKCLEYMRISFRALIASQVETKRQRALFDALPVIELDNGRKIKFLQKGLEYIKPVGNTYGIDGYTWFDLEQGRWLVSILCKKKNWVGLERIEFANSFLAALKKGDADWKRVAMCIS